VAYLLRAYPRFSETFIVNEILELEQRGVEVSILAMRKPEDGFFHESVCRVNARAKYIPETPGKLREKASHLLRRLARCAPRGTLRRLNSLKRSGRITLDDVLAAAYVLNHVRKHRINHLHAHFGTESATLALIADMLGGLSYSLTLHAYDIFRENVDTDLLTRKINHARFVITVSEFNRGYLARCCPDHDHTKVRVLYNGVDLKHFTPGEEPRERWLIFSVGRLIEKKGFLHLIRAVARLRQAGRPARCIIAGDGRQADFLREQIQRLGCQDAVELVGLWRQQRVRECMQRAGCFALPCVEALDGNMDALPTVLLEALACGCPCVSTRLSGIPEIIEHDASGLLVPPGDHVALAQAIERLFIEPGLSRRLSRGARRRARERFNLTQNASQLVDLFHQVITKPETTSNPATMPTPTQSLTA